MPGVPETWRHVVALRNPTQILFYLLYFKYDSSILERDLGYVKEHKLFINVFTTIYWVKPVWPAGLVWLTSTLLIGAICAMHTFISLIFFYRLSKVHRSTTVDVQS